MFLDVNIAMFIPHLLTIYDECEQNVPKKPFSLRISGGIIPTMGVPVQQLQDKLQDCELPTWALLTLVYGAWVALTLASSQLSTLIVAPLAGYLLCTHGSLQHEAVHGHPTRRDWLNTLAVALPLSLWLPYTRYRDIHRAHHESNLTDPCDDPESFYVTAKQWNAASPLRRTLLAANQTLAGRLAIGPLLAVGSFWRAELRQIRAGNFPVLRAWLLHLVGVGVVLYWVSAVCGISPIYYAVVFVYPGLALTLLRSYMEHRPGADNRRRTAIVEGSWLTQLMFLNNNFHLVHHEHPGLPWYRIKGTYLNNKDHWLQLNDHYLYRSYADIARRFALSPKDHPVQPA